MQHEVEAAAARLASHVRRTPVEYSPALSAMTGCRVHLKLENQQLTGSFKLRGAMNKLLSLQASELVNGVVAASTGNHGAGVASAAATLGCRAVIFAPLVALRSKLRAIEDLGAEIHLAGDDCLQAEAAARQYASARGSSYVSPYNDPQVIAGQGTVGLELHQQVGHLDAVFIAVGGGGLISGVGGYLKSVAPRTEVVAASPQNSAVMHASLRAGELLDLPSAPTLSDGTAGGVEAGSITFGLCQQVIDRFVLVSEESISDAVRLIFTTHHSLIEGAAGVAVAACLAQAPHHADQDVAIVLCGANIDPAVLAAILG